jgi:hypothetical protein
MKMKIGAIAAILALSGSLLGSVAAEVVAAPPVAQSFRQVPITGHASNGKSFTGTFTVKRFVTAHGQAYALGTLRGRIAGGKRVPAHSVRIPVAVNPPSAGAARAAANCPVLDLVLGPLDLNLLGLKVHLDRVHLNITAQSGPGNLLGNLVCDIANLLNQNPVGGGQLTAILNALLALTSQLGI